LIDLKSATTDKRTFAATAGATYSFKIISFDAEGNDISSVCSPGMIVNALDTTAPTISAIASQSTDFNTPTKAITFTIGDVGSTIACNGTYLTLSSSDTAIVAPGGVVWSGTYPNCSAVITPVSSGSGNATLTVTVNDVVGNTAASAFGLTVRTAFVIGQPSTLENQHLKLGLNDSSKTLIVGGNYLWLIRPIIGY
jgi:hypothetical protein